MHLKVFFTDLSKVDEALECENKNIGLMHFLWYDFI